MIPQVPAGRASDLAATTVLYRWKGELRVTAICKVTLGFSYDDEMRIAPPVDIARGDIHAARNPMRSVRVSSDLAPHLERVDVLFVGRAHPPGGDPVPRMEVRLAIADEDGEPVLDKRLTVTGDRSGPGAAPTPFKEMPIVYERALGGLGVPDNPLGVGAGADTRQLPNIVNADPERARQAACYGPRAASWPARKKLLRGRPRPASEGIAELPDDVDWIYFQAAPPDQWLDQLPPRAWVMLEGLNPRKDLLHMLLPSMRAMARLQGGRAGVGEAMELRPDTLFIDGEAEHLTLTFRGSVMVPGVEALEDSWVAFALEMPDRPLVWPTAPVLEATTSVPSGAASGTIAMDDGLPCKAPPPAAQPGHAPTGTLIVDTAPAHAPTGTMIISEPATGSGYAPLQAPPPGPPTPMPHLPPMPAPLPPAPARSKFAGTVEVDAPPPFVAPLPFSGARIPSRKSEPPAALPGAPWAGVGPAKPMPAPRSAMTGTMIEEPAPSTVDAPTLVQRAPLPAPPTPAPPPAPPPPAAEPSRNRAAPLRPEDAYQKHDPRDAQPVAAPKPKAALPEKQDIGSALYRRKKP